MAKLVLKFGNQILKERLVGDTPVKIGRSPNNAIVIENPAVSHSHACVTNEKGKLFLQDLDSLNGTFVNGQRVKSVRLKLGDTVTIGKHKILVMQALEPEGWAWGGDWKPSAPNLHETMILGTKERSEFMRKAAEDGERSQIAPGRLKVPTLVVRKGKTTCREYSLTDKLTVIGKSRMATIRLRAWFAPKAAAQINRRADNCFYVGAATKVPMVNSYPATRPTKLLAGDIIEVAGVQLEFVLRD